MNFKRRQEAMFQNQTCTLDSLPKLIIRRLHQDPLFTLRASNILLLSLLRQDALMKPSQVKLLIQLLRVSLTEIKKAQKLSSPQVKSTVDQKVFLTSITSSDPLFLSHTARA